MKKELQNGELKYKEMNVEMILMGSGISFHYLTCRMEIQFKWSSLFYLVKLLLTLNNLKENFVYKNC